VHPVGTRNDLTSILRLAEAVEKSGQAPGPVQFNLIRKEAKKAIAAAKRVKARPRHQEIDLSPSPLPATINQFTFGMPTPRSKSQRVRRPRKRAAKS
jgi:hypothetical protein